MTKNPILDELHAIRQRLLDDAGGTLDALVDRLQAEEQESDRPRYRGRRTIRCTGAAKPGVSAMESQLSPPRDQ